jgi:hypothetical protein
MLVYRYSSTGFWAGCIDGGSDEQDVRESTSLGMLVESDSQVGEKSPRYILQATSWNVFLAVHMWSCSTLSQTISQPSRVLDCTEI